MDGSGWLPGDLVGGPSEFFAKPKVGEGPVGFAASDGLDKKRVSSLSSPQTLLAVLAINSPRS